MDSISAFLGDVLTGSGMGPAQTLWAVALAYLGGVLSSLTPCVYPMIPITVSIMSGGSSGGAAPGERPAWRALWFRGLIYVAGMALVYSFLGVLAGLTGKVFGTLTNTAGWYIGLAAVLTLASLMMMDVLPLDPSVWWLRIKALFGADSSSGSHTSKAASELGWFGVFALGASSGFIAAPCTTPVLASVLAYIANTQSVWLGFVLMLSFSLGLGTILLVVAMFAGSLRLLPRSGAWMKTIKIASGLLLLVFAEYLLFRAGTLSS